MKSFLIRFSLFILPLLILACVAEVLLRVMPNDYSQKNDFLLANSSEIETLILGNSHSFYGLNPIYFKGKAFNASHVSQSLDYDFYILSKYADNFPNLQTVVIPISYFSFFSNLESGQESWRVKNYVLYYDIHANAKFVNNTELFSSQISANTKRLLRYFILEQSLLSVSELGWGTKYKSVNAVDLNVSGEVAAQRHTRLDSVNGINEVFKTNLESIKAIVQWCEQRNVKLILFTPPAYSSYRNNLNENQLSITYKTIDNITDECKSCVYVNYLNDDRFVSSDYFDADHLSEIGAEKLSVIMSAIISGSDD